MAAPPQKPQLDPRASQDASGRLRNAGDELADACAALETEVEELRVKYEMYFLGVERTEPAKWREETRKKVLRLKETFTRNTGLRFRLHSLHARYISYERLWLRSAREREEGTYRRDLFKARLHARGKPAVAAAARKGQAVAPEHHDGEDVDLSDFHDDPPPAPAPRPAPAAAPVAARPPPAAAPARLPAPPPARPAAAAPQAAAPAVKPTAPAPLPLPAVRPAAAAPAAAAGRLGEPQLRELYEAYVSAKKRCNEDTSGLTYDAVARTVSKQIPEIMKTHQAKSVEFKVVIKDGKAKLTAVPKS